METAELEELLLKNAGAAERIVAKKEPETAIDKKAVAEYLEALQDVQQGSLVGDLKTNTETRAKRYCEATDTFLSTYGSGDSKNSVTNDREARRAGELMANNMILGGLAGQVKHELPSSTEAANRAVEPTQPGGSPGYSFGPAKP